MRSQYALFSLIVNRQSTFNPFAIRRFVERRRMKRDNMERERVPLEGKNSAAGYSLPLSLSLPRPSPFRHPDNNISN